VPLSPKNRHFLVLIPYLIRIELGPTLESRIRIELGPTLESIAVNPKFLMVPRDRIELPTRGFSVNHPELPNLLK